MVAYLWKAFSSKHSLIYVVEAIQVGLKCCAQIFIPLEVWNVNDIFFFFLNVVRGGSRWIKVRDFGKVTKRLKGPHMCNMANTEGEKRVETCPVIYFKSSAQTRSPGIELNKYVNAFKISGHRELRWEVKGWQLHAASEIRWNGIKNKPTDRKQMPHLKKKKKKVTQKQKVGFFRVTGATVH